MGNARHRTGALLPWMLAAALAGCASAAVQTSRAPAFDASAYRTYDWATPAPVVIADEERERDAAVLEWTIRNAVDRRLAGKGYERIVAGSPDLLVDFGIRLEEKSTDTFGEYIVYRDSGGKQELGPAFVFGYEEGALVVEITDARSNARLWTGSARTVLDDGQDVTKLEGAVDRILTDFPSSTTAPAARARKPAPSSAGDFRVPEP